MVILFCISPLLKEKLQILWIAPIIFLLMGLITVFFFIRRKKASANLQDQAGSLQNNEEKQNKIRNLLEKGDAS